MPQEIVVRFLHVHLTAAIFGSVLASLFLAGGGIKLGIAWQLMGVLRMAQAVLDSGG